MMSHSYPSDIRTPGFSDVGVARRRSPAPWTCMIFPVPLEKRVPECCPRTSPIEKYFRQWSERPGPGQDSILEQVLKKIGWRGPTKQWTERADQLRIVGTLKNTDTAGHRRQEGWESSAHRDTQGLPHWRVPPTYRPGRGSMFDRRRDGLSQVPCWWTGVTPKALCHCGARPVGSRGGSGDATNCTPSWCFQHRWWSGLSPGWKSPDSEELERKLMPACNGGACFTVLILLRREIDNAFDRNAILVLSDTGELGYLPRRTAQHLAPEIDAGLQLSAEVVSAQQDNLVVRIQRPNADGVPNEMSITSET